MQFSNSTTVSQLVGELEAGILELVPRVMAAQFGKLASECTPTKEAAKFSVLDPQKVLEERSMQIRAKRRFTLMPIQMAILTRTAKFSTRCQPITCILEG